MKVRVYFCREVDPQIILKGNKISKQALNTIYELVWECEFKNILNVGRVWLKFREEERPFGIPVKEKRSHSRIALGDIIRISNDFYMVNEVGARQIDNVTIFVHQDKLEKICPSLIDLCDDSYTRGALFCIL